MSENKVYTAIGLMSGTSLDGAVDVALIRTDGHDFVEAVDFKPYPYDAAVRGKVRACFGKRTPDDAVKEAEALVTELHIRAVQALGAGADVLGFHGQTITHDPEAHFTWQLGDGERLAKETGIDVVFDMRQADMQAGGQGAPLIPLYHKAIASGRAKPLAVLNLGGVANVTYMDETEVIAFDTGPANALIDDYVRAKTGQEFDAGGALAKAGQADAQSLEAFLQHRYFQKSPPKSLDRNTFAALLEALPDSVEDAAATLTAFTAESVAKAKEHFPAEPLEWLVCGGGRKNTAMMDMLKDVLDAPVYAIEEAGWDGDAIEAQGFAYLAVRSLLGLPLTLPTTTGVKQPLTGGRLARAS